MGLRDEVLSELPQWGVKGVNDIQDDTSLIVSGLVDSVGLFQMLLWIEEKAGVAIDPASVDWRREWDTVDAILRYIVRRQEDARAGRPA